MFLVYLSIPEKFKLMKEGIVMSKLILGIDHGYNQMKSENTSFPTALSERESLPDDKKGILEYNGLILDENGTHIVEIDSQDKTINQDFYYLTLISIAKELLTRKIYDAELCLSVGLPQRLYDRQKDDFKKYLMQSAGKNIFFKYNGSNFNIKISNVKVFTQGFSALLTEDTIEFVKKNCCVVDIGGGTVDIIFISNGMIQTSRCKIDHFALNQLYRNIREEVLTQTYDEINTEYILDYIKNNSHDVKPGNDYDEIMQKMLISYSNHIYQLVRENGINPKITPLIFIGGGALVMKNFTPKEYGTVKYILDIKANARGYKQLYQLTL